MKYVKLLRPDRRNICLLFFAASLTALVSVYIAQYIFKMHPCELCRFQRIPYYFVILFSLLGLFVSRIRDMVLYFSIVALFIGAAIAAYHVGIENHWYENFLDCVGAASDNLSIEEMKQQLFETPPVPCDQPAFVFLGISMAGWNAIFSLMLASFGLVNLIKSGSKVE